MSDKFRPIKTTEIRCKQCGHKGMLEVDEKAFNTSMVNYVQKIRESERAKLKERTALLESVINQISRISTCGPCAKRIEPLIAKIVKAAVDRDPGERGGKWNKFWEGFREGYLAGGLLLEADNHFNRLGYTVTAYTDDGVYVRRWDSDHDYFEVRYRTGAKAV